MENLVFKISFISKISNESKKVKWSSYKIERIMDYKMD